AVACDAAGCVEAGGTCDAPGCVVAGGACDAPGCAAGVVCDASG
ncbi:hypothetical protein A2U01_0112309, partial [Trifolium medium]|nr:hypothetical protein [Trifolium medium]